MAERPDDQDLLREEEQAAAAEAAGIGGPDPQPDVDPEDRAVLEGGGGYAEGFEQAEEQLVRQASHEDAPSSPTADAFTPEVESDESGAAYGEADQIDPPDK